MKEKAMSYSGFFMSFYICLSIIPISCLILHIGESLLLVGVQGCSVAELFLLHQ